jgi:hypothetical protein
MWFYLDCAGPIQVSISGPAQTVLVALRESVMRRTSQHRIFQVQELIELNFSCTLFHCMGVVRYTYIFA